MKYVPKSQREEQPEIVGAPIPASITKAIEVNSGDALTAEFEGEEEFEVHQVEVMGREFFIRELDVMSLIDVETQRLTVERGQIVRKPGREAKLGLALEFCSTLMRREGDTWAPLYDLAGVQRFLSKARAKPLILALMGEIYRINPALSAQSKVAAAKALDA